MHDLAPQTNSSAEQPAVLQLKALAHPASLYHCSDHIPTLMLTTSVSVFSNNFSFFIVREISSSKSD